MLRRGKVQGGEREIESERGETTVEHERGGGAEGTYIKSPGSWMQRFGRVWTRELSERIF
jgi:hypothetical protein